MKKRISLFLAVVLLTSCMLVPSSLATDDGIAVSNFQNLNLTSGEEPCGNGVHGGHQTRILHTSHGVYAAYIVNTDEDENDVDANEFAIVRIENGTSTVLYKDFLPADSSSVNIFCDENEEVYVAAIPVDKYSNDAAEEHAWLYIYHLDRETGIVTGYNSILPFEKRVGYGYSMPCIDTANRKIYAIFSGGDAPGYFAWFIFDMDTMTWEPEAHSIEIDYRHCYTHVFADGNGGVFFVAARDITKQAAGHPEIGFADYVWDDLCLFRIPDMYGTEYTQTNIASADYSEGRYFYIANNGSTGDTYLDAGGRLHVLYTIREYTPGTYAEGGNVTLNSAKYHAVYEGNTCIYNEPIKFTRQSEIDNYSIRMAQSVDGTLYILAMPTDEDGLFVELWRATDESGLSFELYGTRNVSDDSALSCIVLSTPRNNSIQDNRVDCLVTNNDGGHAFLYFRLELLIKQPTVTAEAGNGKAALSWTAVKGAAGYKIYQSDAPGSYGEECATVGGSVCSYTVNGLTNGIPYYFVVKAVYSKIESPASNEVSATPLATIPEAPEGLTATAGNGRVELNWTGIDGAMKYKVYQSTVSGFYGEGDATIAEVVYGHEESVAGAVYGYDATGLTNGTTYYYVVKAVMPDGDSPSSNEASATPYTVPGIPRNVEAVAGNGKATVTFDAPADDGGRTVTGYEVTSSPGGITASGTGTSITVTGLANGTSYTFTVRAVNAAGSGAESAASNAVVPRAPSDGSGSSSTPSPTATSTPTPTATGTAGSAGTSTTTTEAGRKVTTIAVDEAKLEQILAEAGENAVVTLSGDAASDVVRGWLSGQMIQDMAGREAVLQVKTETATYSLPSQQLDLAAILAELGQDTELGDIRVEIEIANTGDEMAEVVENSAQEGEFILVAPPVDFTVRCTAGDRTVEIKGFNAYVERTVAIPAGVDPGKVTTAVVVEPDGTVRQVPTRITVIDGRYYAVISSLTNSTYALIEHPVEFRDVASHWAKEPVNDMGSRMIISGVGNGMFEPDREITRAEFAAITVRALGLKPGEVETLFSDVDTSQWYAGYIRTASEYGLISGYGGGKFGPSDRITCEQAMVMIARAMEITGLKADLKADEADSLLKDYGDSMKAAEWAKESIAACVITGLVSGKDGKLLAPADNITRAEVAALIRRLMQKSDLI